LRTLVYLINSMPGSWDIINRCHSPRLEAWQFIQYRISLSKPAQGLAVVPAHILSCCSLYVNVRDLLSLLVLPYVGTILVTSYCIVLSYVRTILVISYCIVLSYVRTTLVITYYIVILLRTILVITYDIVILLRSILVIPYYIVILLRTILVITYYTVTYYERSSLPPPILCYSMYIRPSLSPPLLSYPLQTGSYTFPHPLSDESRRIRN
jgi:hypothetical protein